MTVKLFSTPEPPIEGYIPSHLVNRTVEHEILRKAVEGLDATLSYLRIVGYWHMEEAEEAVKTLRELLPSHLLDI